MPRTKSFDVAQALDKAKDHFWAHGYESTSMDDLLKAMGINRGSFYDTYENKHKLLLDALDCYIEQDIKHFFEQLTHELEPRDAIIALFNGQLNRIDDPKERFGCFLINTALELAPKDQAVASVVEKRYGELTQLFIKLVKQGQADGSINDQLNPTQTGRLLFNHLLGILVLLRSRVSKTKLKSVISQVHRLLD